MIILSHNWTLGEFGFALLALLIAHVVFSAIIGSGGKR